MTQPRLYKPHLFPSFVRPGLWACTARRPATTPGRAIEPVPHAAVLYGTTPAKAYKRWLSWRN